MAMNNPAGNHRLLHIMGAARISHHNVVGPCEVKLYTMPDGQYCTIEW